MIKSAAAADTGSPCEAPRSEAEWAKPGALSGSSHSPPGRRSCAPASRSACGDRPGRSSAIAAHLPALQVQVSPPAAGSFRHRPKGSTPAPPPAPHLHLRCKCRCVGIGQQSSPLEASALRPKGVPRCFHPLANRRRRLAQPVVGQLFAQGSVTSHIGSGSFLSRDCQFPGCWLPPLIRTSDQSPITQFKDPVGSLVDIGVVAGNHHRDACLSNLFQQGDDTCTG
jgi:hypothetical protein